jgi:ketosteroid isomerase-like protein
MKIRFQALILAFLLSPSAMADDLKAEIEAANAAFSAAFGKDAAAVAALYSSAGQVMPNGAEPVSGSAAIAAFWQSVFDSGVVGVTLETLEVERTDAGAVEVGRVTLRTADGSIADRGKYIVIWRHENGAWRLHRDLFNSNVPPPA